VGFDLTPGEVSALIAGPGLVVASSHPNYPHATEVPKTGIDELVADLRGG
jgi:hypothetical protein